jgi:hypothetical protein
MTSEQFLLMSAQGRPVREFESPDAARHWAQKRKESADGYYCPNLILIKKTTTVVEEILDYV